MDIERIAKDAVDNARAVFAGPVWEFMGAEARAAIMVAFAVHRVVVNASSYAPGTDARRIAEIAAEITEQVNAMEVAR